jgi:hypothetical protein
MATWIQSSAGLVSNRCLSDTEEEMEDSLRKHPGAWVVKLSSYLICLHTSSPTVEDVKSQLSGWSGAGASAASWQMCTKACQVDHAEMVEDE